MRTKILFLLLLLANISSAQQIATIGIDKYSLQLKALIENNYELNPSNYTKVNSETLAQNDVLALFNLGQTWTGQSAFSDQQASEILDFVKDGGALFLTSRQAYANILQPLGIGINSKDGGKTGREWEIHNTQITELVPHPITKDVSYIDVDANASITTDDNWTVIGKNKQGQTLIAVRQYGKGKVVLGAGVRSHRDPRETTNRYETDITQGDNYQYFINVFQYLTTGPSSQCKSDKITQLKESSVGKIYPNPTTSRVTVTGKGLEQIQVFDTNGKMVQQHQVTNPTQTELDLGTLPKGIYFLQIKTTTKTYTQEVVLID